MAEEAIRELPIVAQEFRELAPMARRLWKAMTPVRATLRRIDPALEKDFVRTIRLQIANLSSVEKIKAFEYLSDIAEDWILQRRGSYEFLEVNFAEAFYIIVKKLKDWIMFEPREAPKNVLKVVRTIEWMVLKGFTKRVIISFLISLPPAGLIFLFDNRRVFTEAYAKASKPKNISVKERALIFKERVSKLRLGKVNMIVWLSLFALIMSKQSKIKIYPKDVGLKRFASAVV